MEVVAIIFGMPVLIVTVVKYFNYRTRKLELTAASENSASEERIEELEAERAQLEARVQNLETIVTSVDLELNSRLNRLAANQDQQLLLAEHAGQNNSSNAGGAAERRETVALAHTVALEAQSGGLAAGALLMERFEVRELIGRGGMGAVYRALDRQLGEEVALKTISANVAEDPEAADRFRREAGAARKISHPKVIRIHDIGVDNGLLFLSMEYFAGKTLGWMLSQRGQFSLDQALVLLDQIADALSAAHHAGVVHRDLKPANVLVNERQDVRVIDFGLAKASYMRSMTATGLIMGTPEYMAPEQVQGLPVDHRCDVYALAALTFHMLCGRPPFTGDNPISVGFKQCSEPPPAPRSLVPGLPEHVEAAVLQSLAKDREQRHESAEAYKRALRGL
jgi:hypothetical protein